MRTAYPWARLAVTGAVPNRPQEFEFARMDDRDHRRAVYRRVWMSGRRWTRRHRPDLRPVLTASVGGWWYHLEPVEAER